MKLNKIKNKLDKVIKTIESKLPNLAKEAIFVLVIALIAGAAWLYKENKEARITDATVMITSLKGGGGTGVVISNGPLESRILTNNHVCEVVKKGGAVTTNSGKQHLISRIAQSSLHDVCLVYVQSDLGVSAKIAKNAPAKFSSASISGHPNLLPTVVSYGHIADNQIINVFMGVRPCTEADKETEDGAMMCAFFGGIPVLKTFEATLVTAVIMAGSSGSAVYNDAGELAGLAFAGSQGLSYAYTVPFSYVINFLNNEPKNEQIVNYEVSLSELLASRSRKYYKHILNKCGNAPAKIEAICKTVSQDIIFRGLAN